MFFPMPSVLSVYWSVAPSVLEIIKLTKKKVGVLPELKDESVVVKSRLEPGKMFLVDLEAGHIVPDDVVKEKYANRLPYADWIEKNLININGWTKHSQSVGTKVFMHY